MLDSSVLLLLQVLGLFGLSMMSTAAIIGAGIFVLTGALGPALPQVPGYCQPLGPPKHMRVSKPQSDC